MNQQILPHRIYWTRILKKKKKKGILAEVFNKNGNHLNVRQFWVSPSSREQQQQGDEVVTDGDIQNTAWEVLG